MVVYYFLYLLWVYFSKSRWKSLKQLKNEIYSIDNIIENEGIFSNNIDKKLKNNVTSGDFVVVEKLLKIILKILLMKLEN